MSENKFIAVVYKDAGATRIIMNQFIRAKAEYEGIDVLYSMWTEDDVLTCFEDNVTLIWVNTIEKAKGRKWDLVLTSKDEEEGMRDVLATVITHLSQFRPQIMYHSGLYSFDTEKDAGDDDWSYFCNMNYALPDFDNKRMGVYRKYKPE